MQLDNSDRVTCADDSPLNSITAQEATRAAHIKNPISIHYDREMVHQMETVRWRWQLKMQIRNVIAIKKRCKIHFSKGVKMMRKLKTPIAANARDTC